MLSKTTPEISNKTNDFRALRKDASTTDEDALQVFFPCASLDSLILVSAVLARLLNADLSATSKHSYRIHRSVLSSSAAGEETLRC